SLLTQGRPAVDLLFYRDNFLGTAAGDLSNTRRLSLEEAGYTYDFADPGTLAAQGAVAGGRLFPDGPAYKAVVIGGADTWAAGMPGATAQKIAELARSGLPIVFVGDVPSQGTSGREPAAEDAAVREAIGATLGLPDVRHVDSADQVGAALRDLGVVP